MTLVCVYSGAFNDFLSNKTAVDINEDFDKYICKTYPSIIVVDMIVKTTIKRPHSFINEPPDHGGYIHKGTFQVVIIADIPMELEITKFFNTLSFSCHVQFRSTKLYPVEELYIMFDVYGYFEKEIPYCMASHCPQKLYSFSEFIHPFKNSYGRGYNWEYKRYDGTHKQNKVRPWVQNRIKHIIPYNISKMSLVIIHDGNIIPLVRYCTTEWEPTKCTETKLTEYTDLLIDPSKKIVICI
jgi:hypothetical protein